MTIIKQVQIRLLSLLTCTSVDCYKCWGGCGDRFKASDFIDQCEAGYVCFKCHHIWSPRIKSCHPRPHVGARIELCLTSGTDVSLPVGCFGPQSHPGDSQQGSLGYLSPAQSVWPRSAGSRCPADGPTPPWASGSWRPAPADGGTEAAGQDDGHTTATKTLHDIFWDNAELHDCQGSWNFVKPKRNRLPAKT